MRKVTMYEALSLVATQMIEIEELKEKNKELSMRLDELTQKYKILKETSEDEMREDVEREKAWINEIKSLTKKNSQLMKALEKTEKELNYYILMYGVEEEDE